MPGRKRKQSNQPVEDELPPAGAAGDPSVDILQEEEDEPDPELLEAWQSTHDVVTWLHSGNQIRVDSKLLVAINLHS